MLWPRELLWCDALDLPVSIGPHNDALEGDCGLFAAVGIGGSCERVREVKIWSSEGILYIGSRSDLSVRSEINFNETDDAMILDAAVRYLLSNNSWRTLQSTTG